MSKTSLLRALTNVASLAGFISTLNAWCHWKKNSSQDQSSQTPLMTPYSSMPLFSTTLFHLLPSTTFIILWLTCIFLNFNVLLCGTCSFTEVQWQVTSMSYVHKINYWKDEIELVQLDIPLINAYSIFRFSPGLVFFQQHFFLKAYGWGCTIRSIIARNTAFLHRNCIHCSPITIYYVPA